NNISAIIIARDEEDRIADCLDSVSFCDEVIVVDNASSDRTSQIAQRMGAKVVNADFHDFSELRNLGLKKASGKLVLYIDADERIDPVLKKNIENIARVADGASIYRVIRKNFYLGNHEWPKTEKMERLFRRDDLKGWKGKLHESPIIFGRSAELDGFLLHYTHRNLSQMLKKTIEWSKVEAELRYNAGHPRMSWWRFPRVMAGTFLNYYIVQGGYRIGTAGLVESMYQAFSIFTTYARLWELQNSGPKDH
ncbi:MAG: glycosyltransferase family 2 protein, partial [Candidatus Levyibacteriota bacterium]